MINPFLCFVPLMLGGILHPICCTSDRHLHLMSSRTPTGPTEPHVVLTLRRAPSQNPSTSSYKPNDPSARRGLRSSDSLSAPPPQHSRWVKRRGGSGGLRPRPHSRPIPASLSSGRKMSQCPAWEAAHRGVAAGRERLLGKFC